jgi:hypothetical protein
MIFRGIATSTTTMTVLNAVELKHIEFTKPGIFNEKKFQQFIYMAYLVINVTLQQFVVLYQHNYKNKERFLVWIYEIMVRLKP